MLLINNKLISKIFIWHNCTTFGMPLFSNMSSNTAVICFFIPLMKSGFFLMASNSCAWRVALRDREPVLNINKTHQSQVSTLKEPANQSLTSGIKRRRTTPECKQNSNINTNKKPASRVWLVPGKQSCIKTKLNHLNANTYKQSANQSLTHKQ